MSNKDCFLIASAELVTANPFHFSLWNGNYFVLHFRHQKCLGPSVTSRFPALERGVYMSRMVHIAIWQMYSLTSSHSSDRACILFNFRLMKKVLFPSSWLSDKSYAPGHRASSTELLGYTSHINNKDGISSNGDSLPFCLLNQY